MRLDGMTGFWFVTAGWFPLADAAGSFLAATHQLPQFS